MTTKQALTSPLRDWSQVEPGRVYGADDAAALFDVTTASVLRWARAGKLAHLPRLSPKQPVKFLGAELLRALGEQRSALLAGA